MNSINENQRLFWPSQLKLIIVFAAMFFLPTKEEWFRYYTLINCILPLILLDVGEFKRKSVYIWLVCFWAVFFIVSTLFKSYLVPGVDVVREFTELFRIIIIIPILLINKKYLGNSGFIILSKLMAVFVIMNGYMTLAETKFLPKNEFYTFVENNYHYPRQIGLTYLAKGMFSHGALNAVIMNCIIIFIVSMFRNFKYKIFMLLIAFLAMFNMFAGGSRTNMVGIVFFFLIYFGIALFKEKNRISPLLLTLPLIMITGVSFLVSLGLFAKLTILLETGTNTTSVAARQVNWIAFLEVMDNYWYLGVIGWGKSVFSKNSGGFFTDNDYFTYLIVHGIIPFLVIVSMMTKKIFATIYDWNSQNDFSKCFFYLLLFNVLVSTSSAGFSFPLVLIFLALIFTFSKSGLKLRRG